MLKFLALLLVLAFGSIYLTGCIPALIGVMVAGDNDKGGKREKFKEHYDNLNMQREEKGLKPLDWCQEIRKFDPSWAKEQNCPE